MSDPQAWVDEDVPVLENTELWLAADWAASWYQDALEEARRPKGDANARRREIIFAVCCVESYLYEWTRGKVTPHEIERYFPIPKQGQRWRGITQKWKEIPKQLKVDKKIPATPSLGGSDWASFLELVAYRDGLVHGAASRPTSSSRPSATPPVPAVDVLRDMEPGWPVRVVADLVRGLHAAVGTQPQHWLVNP